MSCKDDDRFDVVDGHLITDANKLAQSPKVKATIETMRRLSGNPFDPKYSEDVYKLYDLYKIPGDSDHASSSK